MCDLVIQENIMILPISYFFKVIPLVPILL